MQEVKEIIGSRSGNLLEIEAEQLKQLKQIIETWEGKEFVFISKKQSSPQFGGPSLLTMLLDRKELDKIIEKLDESQFALSSMGALQRFFWRQAVGGSSRLCHPFSSLTSLQISLRLYKNQNSGNHPIAFRSLVTEWMAKLSPVSLMIKQWCEVQRQYLELEAVFTSGIATLLPEEAMQLSNINRHYAKMLTKVFQTKLVIRTCYGSEMMAAQLPLLSSELETIKRSLATLLEQKRRRFPRFYFVPASDMLSIISQAEPQAVRQRLKWFFGSIADITFDRLEKAKILAMISPENETVVLTKPMLATGNVEDWLSQLLACMQVMQLGCKHVCNACIHHDQRRKRSTLVYTGRGVRLQR